MAVELYDEHEQSERVRGWLRENGASLVIGIGLALAGIFGWRQYLAYQDSKDLLASEYYTAIQLEIEDDRLAAARDQLGEMRNAVGDHTYGDLAEMLLAGAEVEAGEASAALDRYQGLLDRNPDGALAPLIRLRLARLYGAEGQGDQALAVLQGEAPVGFESLWLETRGDLLAGLGRAVEAVDAYRAAAEQLRGEGNNARLVEIKLDALRSAEGLTGDSAEAS